MKVAVIFLTVLISGAVSLTCNVGTNVTAKAGLTAASACTKSKCFRPKPGTDNNAYKDYGCGECASSTTTDTCATCATDDCNVFVPTTYALKCYTTSATVNESCTGQETNGCFNVKAGYTGDNGKLKGKFGGCGTCEDSGNAVSASDKTDFCVSCDGDLCNALKTCTKPAAVANMTYTPATDIANGESYTFACSANTAKYNYTLVGKATQMCNATAFAASLSGTSPKCNATANPSSASKAGPAGLTALLVLWYLM